MKEQSFIATIHQKTNPALLQFCLFSCFLSQEEPMKISDALKDPSWVEAMQEELLQFKIQNVLEFAKTSSGKEEVNTASFFTARTQVSPASADVATASFSHDTVCAYIAS
nr:putative ribonuclease H-like domain-containing protein [Tanacetum cinerariifolium]